jgi:hypothetical protein
MIQNMLLLVQCYIMLSELTEIYIVLLISSYKIDIIFIENVQYDKIYI